MTTKPLNRLSVDALKELRSLRDALRPRQHINPGIVRKLLRERLVEVVEVPGPYRTVTRTVPHLRITAAGKRVLDSAPESR